MNTGQFGASVCGPACWRDALKLVALGIAVGIPIAVAGGYSLRAFLFGVASLDPAALAAACAVLALAALLAAYIPARRGCRRSPRRATLGVISSQPLTRSYAARRRQSSRASQPLMRFQLAKVWLTCRHTRRLMTPTGQCHDNVNY